jgi:hypothetical protein
MQRSKELYVDGKRYFTTQYSATKGLVLLTRLAKVVGKPLGILALGKLDEKVTPELIGGIIESIASQIDENGVVGLVQDIISTTDYMQDDGKHRPLVFNTDFAGAYGHLFRLIKEVLAFQYGDFFAESAAQEAETAPLKTRIRARG